jgi:hypothetical protein
VKGHDGATVGRCAPAGVLLSGAVVSWEDASRSHSETRDWTAVPGPWPAARSREEVGRPAPAR